MQGRDRCARLVKGKSSPRLESVSKMCEHILMWRKEDVIEELRKNQGELSLRKYATSLGCSAAYLSDVYAGKRDPGKKLLDHLDLECQKVVTKTYTRRRWR